MYVWISKREERFYIYKILKIENKNSLGVNKQAQGVYFIINKILKY